MRIGEDIPESQMPEVWREETKEIYSKVRELGEKVGAKAPEEYRTANLLYQDVEGKFFLYEVEDSVFGLNKSFENFVATIGLQAPRSPDYLIQREAPRFRMYLGFRDDDGAIEEFLDTTI